MVEFITGNAGQLGTGIVAFASLMTAAWLALQNIRAKTAKATADVAISDSQKEVYEQLRQRLSDMQADLNTVRQELGTLREQVRERDNKIHALEMHIKDLEHEMRQKGLTPPPLRFY